ncbi:MAG: hypothetical protein ACOVLC_03015 [Flavobacterium sp.]
MKIPSLEVIIFDSLTFPKDFSIQCVDDLAPIDAKILFEAFSASKRL